MIDQDNGMKTNAQLEKKEKPELGPEATTAHEDEGADVDRRLSRKEEKAPAREEPTTGEAPLIASQSSQGIGAGAGASDKKEIHFADKDTQSTATAPVELGEVAGVDEAGPAPQSETGEDPNSSNQGVLGRLIGNLKK